MPTSENTGQPIRYSYVGQSWPSEAYQTVFANETGSAEMPSAGRPFTPELVTVLVSRGVGIAPLVLHTGVSSLESHEPPYEEYYRVPRHTAERVNATKRAGGRVIAVGTTVVRALETVTDDTGTTSPGEGWTDLVITSNRPLRCVTGLITGFHAPRATHLMLLERVVARGIGTGACGRCHLERAYAEAKRLGYLWHEFGDSHLIIAGRPSISEPVAHAAAETSEIPVAIEAEIAGIDVDEQPPEQAHAGAGAGGARHPRPHD